MDLSFCCFAFSLVCSSILLLLFLLCPVKRIGLSHFGSYNKRKSHQSNNLEAEERRRKKLNDSLLSLRSLVPTSSKLDRASILGDTIEFVKDLQKQVKELQDELEQHTDMQQPDDTIVGVEVGQKADQIKTQEGFHVGSQKQELDATDDNQTQQMEPQVEVGVIDGNELLVKVFCEHRPVGFLQLMEAFNTLRMQITHASVTTHKGLVSNIFKVQKENEMVGAENVRDSLLELMRKPK